MLHENNQSLIIYSTEKKTSQKIGLTSPCACVAKRSSKQLEQWPPQNHRQNEIISRSSAILKRFKNDLLTKKQQTNLTENYFKKQNG